MQSSSPPRRSAGIWLTLKRRTSRWSKRSPGSSRASGPSSDTDCAGCLRTRRRTSGGPLMRTWFSVQSVVATSSPEAELVVSTDLSSPKASASSEGARSDSSFGGEGSLAVGLVVTCKRSIRPKLVFQCCVVLLESESSHSSHVRESPIPMSFPASSCWGHSSHHEGSEADLSVRSVFSTLCSSL